MALAAAARSEGEHAKRSSGGGMMMTRAYGVALLASVPPRRLLLASLQRVIWFLAVLLLRPAGVSDLMY